MRICRTCAVEYAEPVPQTCPICADERQWVPADGQHWTSLEELAAAGQRLTVTELEPRLFGIRSDPTVGIGQQAILVVTEAGNVLWDPVGYVDDATAAEVRSHGPVAAIVASHPHMFGVQLEWSRRLGNAPVLVAAADREWLGRGDDAAIELYDDGRELVPGVQLHRVGGHFPGSAILEWPAGADGRGVLLTGDTISPNPDRTTIAFMRSYPNRLPLSAAVTRRIADHLGTLRFDRIYGNFNNVITEDAAAAVERSAQRHIGWVRGDFDHLT